MPKNKKIKILSFFLIIITVFLLNLNVLGSIFSYPLTPARISPLEKYVILDITGVLGGLRRLVSDIAWVQLLQYYGSPEYKLDKETEFKLSIATIKFYLGIKNEHHQEHEDEHHHEHDKDCKVEHKHSHGHSHEDLGYHPNYSGGSYPELINHCYRIVYLDPFFHYVYLYGAGALAWNLDRPDEAIELLSYGITVLNSYRKDYSNDVHQPIWRLNLYISAIVYCKSGEYKNMINTLELAVKEENCPNMIKAILANIYQKDKKYINSLKLWLDIYDSKDPTYSVRSHGKVMELKSLLGI